MLGCILDFIRLRKRTTMDELCRYFSVTAFQLDSILHIFELKGWVTIEQSSGCGGCAQKCAHQHIVVANDS